jgi:hypothetical protein
MPAKGKADLVSQVAIIPPAMVMRRAGVAKRGASGSLLPKPERAEQVEGTLTQKERAVNSR